MTSTKQAQKGLEGLRVLSFESRMADLMVQGIARHGGEPLSAPSMQEVPLERNSEAFAFGQRLLAGGVDVMIFLTGVGTRMLFQTLSLRYEEEQVLDALSKIMIVARGPKPLKVLQEYGVAVTLKVPEPNTWRETLQTLDGNQKTAGLKGKSVAIQEYGVSNDDLIRGLKQRGAGVVQVPVYRWALPEDRGPLVEGLREVAAGKVDVAVFTSAIQIRHVVRVASEKGIEEDFRKGMGRSVVVSIGPTTTEALRAAGLGVDFEPSHPKMGTLLSELAKEAAGLVKEKKQGRTPSVVLHAAPFEEKDRTARRDTPFMKACRCEAAATTPVWLMRQAGRYMKEYRRLRDQVSFKELCQKKELTAEVTITAVEKIKADAAIIFSDLLLILEPLGFRVTYETGGPVVQGPSMTAQNVDKLPEVAPQSLAYVYEGISLTRASLNSKIPLLGFAGLPFTLASYLLEGGASKHFLKTKKLMHAEAGVWHALMEKITRALIPYLNAQMEAGADAVQLFDSWAGCLSPEEYREFVLPHSRAVMQGLRKDVPVIHFGTGTAAFLKEMREAGGQVIGVDWRVDLAEAWRRIGYDAGIQGNLDPAVLLAPPAEIKKHVQRILKQAGGRPGHIFNLGHGILPQTPVENVIALVEMVHEMSQK